MRRRRARRGRWLRARGGVAASTRDAALIARFTPVSLDTFFRGVVIDGLVDVGPLRVDGVPVEGRGDQLGARRAWRACTSDRKPKK